MEYILLGIIENKKQNIIKLKIRYLVFFLTDSTNIIKKFPSIKNQNIILSLKILQLIIKNIF